MRVDSLKACQPLSSDTVFLSFVDSVQNNSIFAALLKYYIKLSITDSLTGAYNKRYLFQHLSDDISNCYVCMIDVDDFKSINDTIGHVDSDYILVDICNIIRSEMSVNDVLIRFGGDEFIVLYSANNIKAAKHMLCNVQFKISEKYRNSNVHPKISYGIAKHIKSLQILDTIRTADLLMYSSRCKKENTPK